MASSGAPKLSPRHRKAVELLVMGHSIRAVARELNVGDSTVRRWLAKREVQEALTQAQEEVWRHTIRRLRSLGTRAIDTLNEILGDRTAPPSSRVSGAKCVLEAIFKAAEMEKVRELEERIERLESKLRGVSESEVVQLGKTS